MVHRNRHTVSTSCGQTSLRGKAREGFLAMSPQELRLKLIIAVERETETLRRGLTASRSSRLLGTLGVVRLSVHFSLGFLPMSAKAKSLVVAVAQHRRIAPFLPLETPIS